MPNNEDPVVAAGRAHLKAQQNWRQLEYESRQREASLRAEQLQRQHDDQHTEDRRIAFLESYVKWLRDNNVPPKRRFGVLRRPLWPVGQHSWSFGSIKMPGGEWGSAGSATYAVYVSTDLELREDAWGRLKRCRAPLRAVISAQTIGVFLADVDSNLVDLWQQSGPELD